MPPAADGTTPRLADRLLEIEGTVQGVGFRPFVARLAARLGVRGWVRNDERGVTVRAVGSPDMLDALAAARRAAATFADGASNTNLSGVFYFPNGTISLGGSASVGSGTGQCLELIGSQLTLTGGTTAASTCIAGTTSNSSVRLVQ